MVKLVECPRDAMQGIDVLIPTEEKVKYMNSLFKVGFHTIDAGSFVSPKSMPQMADTAAVFKSMNKGNSASRVLAIAANTRGAVDACAFEIVDDIGFPFSVSETFQKRNTNSTIAESLQRVHEIAGVCESAGKELVLYISMGFGNPYGDTWNAHIVTSWCKRLHEEIGIKTLALSDTIGVATPQIIHLLFEELIPSLPEIEFGAHLHTVPDKWREKVESAWKAGCRRFDGAIRGYGGCPMAEDELTGNMPTENLVAFFDEMKVETGLNQDELRNSMRLAETIFPSS